MRHNISYRVSEHSRRIVSSRVISTVCTVIKLIFTTLLSEINVAVLSCGKRCHNKHYFILLYDFVTRREARLAFWKKAI